MPRLSLLFGDRVLRQVPVADHPLTIGRTPDNDIQIDNPAVSNVHARVYAVDGRIVVEDLNSLNGTFVNNQLIQRATLHHGDRILIGKHHLAFEEAATQETSGAAPEPKPQVPHVDETVVLETRQLREMVQQAASTGERTQVAPQRLRLPTLVVLAGRTDQAEYLLTGKLTVLGRSPLATVRLKGWFKPSVAAWVSRREHGYYLGRAGAVPKVNGQPISGPLRLQEGDLIEVSGVKLSFIYRD